MKEPQETEEVNIRDAMANAHASVEHVEEGGESNWLVSYADMMTLLVMFFVILLSFSTIDPKKFEQMKKSAAEEFGGSYQVPFEQMSKRIQESVRNLGLEQSLNIHQTDDGVEISITGTVFFELGSANLKAEAVDLVRKIIPIIQAEPTDFDIVIEGHTDDVPVSSKLEYQSNWELSSVRACRVLNSFEIAGFPKNRLTAVGYGDARPLLPNRDLSGAPIAANQEKNRRVLIKLTRHAAPTVGSESVASH